ncbi:MAG: hypothetical protein EKK56_00940 [Flavobacteriaceae bacterium]|nr:MAG: hypothetical protein EKK56_00940 [Flavobacteriaceae bacterium]
MITREDIDKALDEDLSTETDPTTGRLMVASPFTPGNLASAGLGALKGLDRTLENTEDFRSKLFGEQPFPHAQFFAPTTSLGSLAGQAEQKHPISFNLGLGIGETLPTMVVPEIGGPSLAARAIQDASQLGAVNALNNPNDALDSFVEGAGLGGASRLLFGGASNLMVPRGTSTANAAQALGVNLPTGDILENPSLTSLQRNVLGSLPGSNINEKYVAANEKLHNAAYDNFNDMLGGNDPLDIQKKLQSSLKQLNKQALQKANENYENLGEVAAALNLGDFIPTNSYKNAISELLSRENYLGANRPEFNTVSDKEFKKFLEEGLKGPDKIDFNLARKTEEKLNELARDAYKAGDNTKGDLYTKLKHAGRNDIEQALKSQSYTTKVPKDLQNTLPEMWNVAKQQYQDEVAPFNTVEMQKFISKPQADPDLLTQSFVKTGQFERPTLLSQLTNKLKPEDKNILAYSFLTKKMPTDASGRPIVDLNMLERNYSSLGPNMKKILLDPKHQSNIENILTIKNALPKKLDTSIWEHHKNKLAVLGPMTLLAEGHPGSAALMGATAGLGAASNLINSPKLQNFILNNPTALSSAVSSLSAPVAGALLEQ